MSVQTIKAHQNNLRKPQRAFVAQKMIEALNSHEIWKRIGSFQQALAMEAITFHFKQSPFEYELDVEITEDEITKDKSIVESYIFKLDVTIPATSHSIQLETKIDKNILDVK